MLPAVLAAGSVAKAEPRLKELKKACDGMESNFLKQMLTAMHKTVTETNLEGEAPGMDTYKGMMDDAVADHLAQRGTLGISKMVFRSQAEQAFKQAIEKK